MEQKRLWFPAKRILMNATTKQPQNGGVLASFYYDAGDGDVGVNDLLLRNEQACSMRDWLLKKFPLEVFPMKA